MTKQAHETAYKNSWSNSQWNTANLHMRTVDVFRLLHQSYYASLTSNTTLHTHSSINSALYSPSAHVHKHPHIYAISPPTQRLLPLLLTSCSALQARCTFPGIARARPSGSSPSSENTPISRAATGTRTGPSPTPAPCQPREVCVCDCVMIVKLFLVPLESYRWNEINSEQSPFKLFPKWEARGVTLSTSQVFANKKIQQQKTTAMKNIVIHTPPSTTHTHNTLVYL